MEAIHSNHYKPMSDTNVYKTAIENGCPPRWRFEVYLNNILTGYYAVDQLFKNVTRLRDHKKHSYILTKTFGLIVGGRIVIYVTALQGLFPGMRRAPSQENMPLLQQETRPPGPFLVCPYVVMPYG